MTCFRAIAVMCALIVFPATSAAHHGVSGQFDLSRSFEVSGTITRVRLVNPHAYLYFDITDGANDITSMRCEMLPGSTLKRTGWTEEMFTIGSRITVNGSPDRDDPSTCYMHQITFQNGMTASRDSQFEQAASIDLKTREMVRSDGTPNIHGNWMMAGRHERGAGPPSVTLTPAGAAAVVGASPEQNPRFNCQPTNIILDWWFNQNVNSITQSDTQIVLTYGFMDLVRTIHLDGAAKPADFTPRRAGYSTGVWDGNTLVVTTTGFDEGWINAPLGRLSGARPGGDYNQDARPPRPNRPERPEGGDRPERPERPEGRRGGPQPVKNSKDLTVVERFTLNADGNVLTRDYVLTDPLYFEGSIAGQDQVTLTAEKFAPYACEDLTNEEDWAPGASLPEAPGGVLFALETSFIGEMVSGSVWGYPTFLSLHALGMAVMVGVSLMLMLSLLGFAVSIPVMAISLYWRTALGGFVLNLLSGTALFFGSASELAVNWAFWTKISLVCLSLSLTWWLVRARTSRADDVLPTYRTGAGLAIMTWVAAIVSGRLIGYVA